MDQPRFSGADLVLAVDFLPLLFGFSFVFGSALNLLLWCLLGFRPRYGFLVSWVVAGEFVVVVPLGWGVTLIAMAIALLMFWAMGEEHLTYMAREASDLGDVVGPGVFVVNTMKLPSGMAWSPRALDGLPHDRRVVVCSFLRPLLERHLRRRGFTQQWVTYDRLVAWPVWVRDAAAEPGLEPMSAR